MVRVTLIFKLEGIIDIDAEFSYVARVPRMGWLTFSYLYAEPMQQWANDVDIQMQRITDKTLTRARPGYAFRTESDRMMFVLAWGNCE